MNCGPPGSSVHGISQAKILEWVAISFSRESSQARDQTQVYCIASTLLHCRWILYQLSQQGSPLRLGIELLSFQVVYIKVLFCLNGIRKLSILCSFGHT